MFIFFVITVPAFLVVGLWFVFQVLNGYGSLGGEEAGGVAYAAHIGGFIFGLILVKRFANRVPLSTKRKQWNVSRPLLLILSRKRDNIKTDCILILNK
jgi:membrane associated rhomboid family serine protease